MFFKKILALYLLIFLGYALKLNAATLENVLPDLIYYDADTINIKENLNVFEFNGDAAFLMGDLFLTADKIEINKAEKLVFADGNVKVIYKKTQATASKMIYDSVTKQLRMNHAKIFSDPNSKDNVFDREALGFTKAEIAFDETKKIRMDQILKQLKSIRVEYVKYKNLASLNKNDESLSIKIKKLEKQYSELLTHYNQLENQPNEYFNALPEDLKTKYLERRAAVETFNKDYPGMAEKILNFSDMPSYIYVSASEIIQEDNNTYLLNATFITPCNCGSSGVPPIFGFSAQKAELELDQYATMEGFTFDIFSIPIFYLPWTKLSIKQKRQTGFLYPSGYLSNDAGYAIAFPFYLTLGDHADATTTYQYFSKGGSRVSEHLRVSFLENSLLNLGGNVVFDRTYNSQWETNKQKVDTAIQETSDPVELNRLQGYVGRPLDARWYGETSLNIPFSEDLSLKFNGQVVSDNTYIYEFETSTAVDTRSTVYGNTTSAARRFLHQTVEGEYYGNHITLSARGTRYQDLFALSQNLAPVSLPLLEFTLLPFKLFLTPIYISNKTAFEDVIASTKIHGKRLASTVYFTLKLPENKYLNSYIELQESFVQYYSPSDSGVVSDVRDPYEFSSNILLHTDIPFYAKSKIYNDKKDQTTILKSEFKPFIDLDYTPVVSRSDGFPLTYKLWYAADNWVRSAFVSVGATWGLNIRRFSFKQEKTDELDPNVTRIADTDVLSEVVQSHSETMKHPAHKAEFLPPDTLEATEIYMEWAVLELTRFYDAVEKSEFNKMNLVHDISENADLNFTPLYLKLYTNYNILADKTADELNTIAGPIFSPTYLPERFGDLSAELDASLLPFMGWRGSILYSYSFVYSRINTITASTNLSLGWGLAGMARYQILYNVDPRAPYNTDQPLTNEFVKKTFLNFGLSYMPRSYVKLGFEWAKNTDTITKADSTDTEQGRAYGSSFYINFLNLQECLDLFIARNKPAGFSENQATYSIGVNIKFFGHEATFNPIASY